MNDNIIAVMHDMRIEKNVKFPPGFYLVSYTNGKSQVLRDIRPIYEDDEPLMLIGGYVSTDHIGDSDAEGVVSVYVDVDDVSHINKVSESRVEFMRSTGRLRSQLSELQIAIDHRRAVMTAMEIGVVSKPPEAPKMPTDDSEGSKPSMRKRPDGPIPPRVVPIKREQHIESTTDDQGEPRQAKVEDFEDGTVIEVPPPQ